MMNSKTLCVTTNGRVSELNNAKLISKTLSQ